MRADPSDAIGSMWPSRNASCPLHRIDPVDRPVPDGTARRSLGTHPRAPTPLLAGEAGDHRSRIPKAPHPKPARAADPLDQ
jgi:hypothetical protein